MHSGILTLLHRYIHICCEHEDIHQNKKLGVSPYEVHELATFAQGKGHF